MVEKAASRRICHRSALGQPSSSHARRSGEVIDRQEVRGALFPFESKRTFLLSWNSSSPPRVSGSAAVRALDGLPHDPILMIRRLAALLEVSVPSAAAAVDQLRGAGVVEQRTGYRRNRLFAAHEARAIINRPFGAAPVLPGVG
jgi:hypothetical protein